jgi:hypothetical protein
MPANYSPALNANVNPWFSGKTSSFNELRERTAPFDPAGLYASAVPGAWFEPSRTTCFKYGENGVLVPASFGDAVAAVIDQASGTSIGSDYSDEVDVLIYQGNKAPIPDGDGYFLYRSLDSTNINYLKLPAVGLTEILFEIEEDPNNPGGRISLRDYGTHLKYLTPGTHRILYNFTNEVRWFADIGDSVKVTLLSARKIAGNHAFQPVVAKMPVLARAPRTGIRNMLPFTGAYDKNEWQMQSGATKTPNQAADRRGNLEACLVNLQAGRSSAFMRWIYLEEGAHTHSVWVKRAGDTDQEFCLSTWNGTERDLYSPKYIATEEWQRFSFTAYQTVRTSFRVTSTGAAATLLVCDQQVESGDKVTAFQKVVSVYDIIEEGTQSVSRLEFDGVDDFMVTQPIEFNSTDEMAVFAGVKKTGISRDVIIAELGESGGVAPQDRPLDPLATGDYVFYTSNDVGDVFSDIDTENSSVLSAVSDISDQVSMLRIGGEAVSVVPVPQGSGNYSTYPLYIGARAGTSMFFKGNVFSLLVVGQQTDPDTTLKMEERTDARTRG